MRKPLPRLSLFAAVSALAGAALFLPGCGNDVHDGVNMKNRVGFGAVIPNTGTYREIGSELYRGMLTAEYSLNASGKVEDKFVKVVMYDSTGESQKGLDGVRKLTRDFDMPFMAVAMPGVVDRVVEEYSQYDTVAARLEAASRDTEKQADNAIQAYVSADDEIAVIAAAAAKEGWKNVLTLMVEDRYGDAAAERLANALTKSGIARADRLPLRSEESAYERIREAAASTKYDAICIFAHGPEVAPALIALRKSGHNGPIVGNHAFGGRAVTRLHRHLLKNVRYTAPEFHTRPDRPMAARFLHEYKELNRDLPDIHSALGYDQVMMVFSAAKAEESIDPATVRRRLIADKTFEGAAGTYHFDENGFARLDLTLEPVPPRSTAEPVH